MVPGERRLRGQLAADVRPARYVLRMDLYVTTVASALFDVRVEATARGIRRVVLGGAPGGGTPIPPHLRDCAERLGRYFDGEGDALATVPLDLEPVGPFREAVYAALRRVPAGRTVGYAELAALVGRPGGARAVGRAMATNPVPLLVPCHRVLAAHGAGGGFSAPGGFQSKRRLLALEGVAVAEPRPRRAGAPRAT